MATNFARAHYTEVVDMQTVDGKLSVIGIHTPVGKSPYAKLKGFFTQFRKYRYNGIKNITIVPASGLPIDPLGLSVQSGSTDQMDPRDTFNPILFKGCHGEQLHQILDKLMGENEYVTGQVGAIVAGTPSNGGNNTATGDEVSASLHKLETELDALTAAEKAYYMWLTDPTWKKFGIQSVVKLKNLYPLVWKMARNMPLLPSASGTTYMTNAGEIRSYASGSFLNPATASSAPAGDGSSAYGVINDATNVGGNAYVQEFTSGCERLGWLPTTIHTQGTAVPLITALPKLFMGVLVLPPCYSINQFMRAVIVHSFSFKDFNTSTGAFDPIFSEPQVYTDDKTSYYNWIDYATSKGGTFDIFNGEAELISDGVN